MVKQIKAVLEDVPVVLSVADDAEKDTIEGIVESVQWECSILPAVAQTEFLKAAGITMPDDLNKPGVHDRVLQALRVALSNKQVLRQLTDVIVRTTKEIYNGS